MTGQPAPIIGLHMIVRDEEAVIGRCLASVLPGVSRVAIHDTGSTDGTLAAITAALSDHGFPAEHAHVESAPWPEDFSEARQAALGTLLTRWPEVTHVVWCDADDVVVGSAHLPAWAAATPPGSAGWCAHYAYGYDPSGGLVTSHHRERLIPVDALVGWRGAVHENLVTSPGLPYQPMPAPPDSQVPGGWPRSPTGVEWRHYPNPGRDSLGRNRAILRRILDATPDEPRTMLYLAQEHALHSAMHAAQGEQAEAAAEHAEAVRMLRRHREVLPGGEQGYQARHRLADLHRAVGDHAEALREDLAAVGVLPGWPDAWYGAAESYLALGLTDQALAYWTAGAARPYPATGLILDPTDYTTRAWDLRARIAEAQGDTEAAHAWAQRAAEAAPHDHGLQHQAFDAATRASDDRARTAWLTLDEHLARNDENEKAARLADVVPHRLLLDPEVRARAIRRRRGVRHATEPAEYLAHYATEDPFVRFTDLWPTPLPVRDAVDALAASVYRGQWLIEKLRAEADLLGIRPSALRVLDVGCHDGWLSLLAADRLGCTVTGLEQNARAAAAAREHAEAMGVADRVTILSGSTLDKPVTGGHHVAWSFEVIEHVPCVDTFLDTLAGYVTPGGLVLLSTPDGAFERGRVEAWDSPEARGHLRALTPAELAAAILDHGELDDLQAGRPDRVMVAALRPRPRVGTIDMWLGQAGQSWSPMDVNSSGLGGSETMAVRVATRLAESGWRVRVYGAVRPAAVAGVEYLPWWAYDPTVERDVLIASRHPGMRRDLRPRARHTVLWLHDAEYPDLTEHAGDWDEVWCVGEWQRQHLGLSRAVVMPNGIDLRLYPTPAPPFSERAEAVIYSSSPDRGLARLLDVWPRVREQVPGAMLHIAYGFTATYMAMEGMNPTLGDLRRRVLDAAGTDGIVFHGALGQPRLAALQRAVRAWVYPTSFPEVSCITAMEAQAAGLAVITTGGAELPTTLRGYPAETGDLDDDALTRLVVRAITDAAWWEAHTDPQGGRRFDLDHVADQWDARLRDALGLDRTAQRWPVPPGRQLQQPDPGADEWGQLTAAKEQHR